MGLDVTGLGYEFVRRVVDGEELEFEVDRALYVAAMLSAWREVVDAMLERPWSIFIARKDAGLLVASDSPISVYQAQPDTAFEAYRSDIRNPATGVMMPVDPSTMPPPPRNAKSWNARRSR